MFDTIDYLPLPERHHHHDRPVVDGGFAGAVAGTLGVAVAEADLPAPSALLALGPEGGSLSRAAASRTAAAEALAAAAEALAVVVAEADGGIPTPSSRSPSFAWGAVTAPASLASRVAGKPSRVWVATETTGGRSSAERSS
jgi:hypothetical protein